MKEQTDIRFASKCIHAGQRPEPITGAVMTPIFQSSTYAQKSPGQHTGYEYSRTQNPTRKALEENLAALEGGNYGFCFSSGCAAVTALLMAFAPGDHIIAMEDLYGGTHRLFNKIFTPKGLHFSYLDLSNTDNLANHITQKTKLIWIETPSNPLLKIVDLLKISEIGKKIIS